MAKLTKRDAKLHAQACQLLEKETLSHDDKYFVLEHWREDANHVNSVSGAFFTPPGLARDLAMEVSPGRVIDLCAGIGALAFAVSQRGIADEITCVEINPEYIAVGKKVVPEAKWISADVFALPADISDYDCAIANPPFGMAKATHRAPRFTGNVFEYRIIDIASDLANRGVFIVPQASAPFEYSGKPSYRENEHEKYKHFARQTGITLVANCGIDTSVYSDEWTIKPPPLEIVIADFHEARKTRTCPEEVSLKQNAGVPHREQLKLFPEHDGAGQLIDSHSGESL